MEELWTLVGVQWRRKILTHYNTHRRGIPRSWKGERVAWASGKGRGNPRHWLLHLLEIRYALRYTASERPRRCLTHDPIKSSLRVFKIQLCMSAFPCCRLDERRSYITSSRDLLLSLLVKLTQTYKTKEREKPWTSSRLMEGLICFLEQLIDIKNNEHMENKVAVNSIIHYWEGACWVVNVGLRNEI